MSRRYQVNLFFILLVTSLAVVPAVRADLPPPIYYAWIESGGPFTLASNVTLPEASVDTNIHLTDSWTYNINVSCSFTITSLISQNLTTAFVYPEIWLSADPSQSVSVRDFNIFENETLVEYSIITFDEFKSKYDLNQTDWENVNDCSFALFNFSVNSEQPTNVNVVTCFTSHSSGHDFVFEYIVDTARRWEGNTHEIVQIEFHRSNDTEIIGYGYDPEDDADFTGDDNLAIVTWDFTIQEFPYDRVRFTVQQQKHPVYNRVIPIHDIIPIIIATTIVLVLFVSSLIYRRFKSN